MWGADRPGLKVSHSGDRAFQNTKSRWMNNGFFWISRRNRVTPVARQSLEVIGAGLTRRLERPHPPDGEPWTTAQP